MWHLFLLTPCCRTVPANSGGHFPVLSQTPPVANTSTLARIPSQVKLFLPWAELQPAHSPACNFRCGLRVTFWPFGRKRQSLKPIYVLGYTSQMRPLITTSALRPKWVEVEAVKYKFFRKCHSKIR